MTPKRPPRRHPTQPPSTDFRTHQSWRPPRTTGRPPAVFSDSSAHRQAGIGLRFPIFVVVLFAKLNVTAPAISGARVPEPFSSVANKGTLPCHSFPTRHAGRKQHWNGLPGSQSRIRKGRILAVFLSSEGQAKVCRGHERGQQLLGRGFPSLRGIGSVKHHRHVAFSRVLRPEFFALCCVVKELPYSSNLAIADLERECAASMEQSENSRQPTPRHCVVVSTDLKSPLLRVHTAGSGHSPLLGRGDGHGAGGLHLAGDPVQEIDSDGVLPRGWRMQ